MQRFECRELLEKMQDPSKSKSVNFRLTMAKDLSIREYYGAAEKRGTTCDETKEEQSSTVSGSKPRTPLGSARASALEQAQKTCKIK